MDDDFKREDHIARVDARTSDRVAQMSDEEREELARELARRRGAGADAPPPVPEKKVAQPPTTARPVAPDASVIARLTTELRATERRLDRLERLHAPGRYGGTAQPSGRYYRLLSRADRIERKLRDIR